MTQTYSIILWRKPEKEEILFEEIASRIYDSLCVLQKYDDIFRPNYFTVKKKNNAFRFEWNATTFFEKLQDGVMKIGKKEIPELGYSISFFSSLDDEESCGIRLRVGSKDNRFVNSLVINLPNSINYSEELNSNMLKRLFCELVDSFEPFWGCVSSNQFKIGDLKYLSGNTPLYLNWLNYWSKEVESTVSDAFWEKIKDIANVTYNDGILQISKIALDCRNDEDVEYFKNVNYIFRKDNSLLDKR